MIRKIKLYGPLRKLSGVKEFEANVSNVDQVYSFIKVNYPNCHQHLNQACYSVVMNDVDITFKNLVIIGEGDIKVIPVVSGNVFFLPFLSTFVGGLFVQGATIASALTSALVVGGLSFLADLLAPTPPSSNEIQSDPEINSFISGATTNTTKSGGAAPLIFGEFLVGSVVISASADTVEVRNI